MRTRNGREGRAWWLRLPILAALIALMAVVAIACGDDDDDDGDDDGDETAVATEPAGGETPAPSGKTITIPAGESIKIGVSVTLTTENAELGFPIRDAALMSIEEYGPVEGFTVEAVLADDLCSGPGSEAAAKQPAGET